MGQKINPIALRLGGRTTWLNNNYSTKFYHQDLWINKIVEGIFKELNVLVSELVIKRTTHEDSNEGMRDIKLWSHTNKPISISSPSNENIQISISGLLYKPEVSDNIKDTILVNEQRKVDSWSDYKEILKCGRSQSKRTQLLLEEINHLIIYILKDSLDIKGDIVFNWEQVKTPLSNSNILSNYIEMVLLENSRINNDRKVLKWLFEDDKRINNSKHNR